MLGPSLSGAMQQELLVYMLTVVQPPVLTSTHTAGEQCHAVFLAADIWQGVTTERFQGFFPPKGLCNALRQTHSAEHGNLRLNLFVLFQSCQYGRHSAGVSGLVAVHLGCNVALKVAPQGGLRQACCQVPVAEPHKPSTTVAEHGRTTHCPVLLPCFHRL